ncbi:hypothetical protein [Streptomyces coelicoflavus]|uniref:hypothetical protein n=1 Tax=Streptomyces coelicoflavus TaxID=285562 RepID=UPI000D59A8AC|nr:hypothetical protein [Streptomyces coelicoflavus]
MTLNVGELVATITADPRGMTSGLNRAEGLLRASGQTMADDADRAGQQAGQQLGDGIVAGADGRLRDLRGRFTTAARQAGDDAGDALGDGLADSGGEGAEQASQTIGDKLKGGLKLAAAGVGAAAGALLMQAFGEAMDQGQAVGKLRAQLGATPAEAKRYGEIAGRLYTSAVTDTFEEGTQAIRHAMQSGLIPPDATNAQIESISRKVTDLSKTFEVDLGDATTAVGQMIRTGMVRDANEGLDLIGKAFQINDKRADDMLETLNEYPTQFRDLGLTGSQALGIMQQGFDGASKDSDKVADALKELNIRVQDLSGAEGLQKLKIDANEAAAAFGKGGPEAAAMLDLITDRLRAVKDPSERYRLSQELLGTQSEDLSKALLSIDPSQANERLGDFKGTLDEAGNALRDNAGTRVKQFQRGLQQGVVDFLGGTVIPGLASFGKKLGGIWDTATAGMDGASLAAKLSAFVPMLGDAIASKIATIGPKIAEGLAMAGSRAAEWAMANPTAFFKVAAFAAAFLLALAFLPELLIAGVAATVGLIIGGFVAKLIQAAQVKLPEWGEAISDWFGGLWSKYVSGPISRTWNSLVSSVKELPGKTVGALAALGSMLASTAARHWQRFSTATAQKVVGFISWVRGIPGRITGAIGNLGSLLYSKGVDVVRGLWNGIKSMGSWLRSTLIGWAKDLVPGPIAKALGISSPSKVMAKDIGRWIPAGIAKGITDNAGVVDRTMSGLVDTPTPSATMSASMGAVGGGQGGRGAQAPRVVRLDGGSELGDAIIKLIRQRVGVSGGDVQFVLGR